MEDEDLDHYYELNENLKKITIRKYPNLNEYLDILNEVIDTNFVHDEDRKPIFHYVLGDNQFSVTDGGVNVELQHISDDDMDDEEDMESSLDIYYRFIINNYNKKASDTSFFKDDSINKCFYFKYWFYDYLINNKISKKIINEFFSLLFDDKVEDDALNVYREQDSETCQINRMELHQIKNIKILYDYLENYDNDTHKAVIEGKIKKSKFCTSFNVLIKEYNKTVDCISTGSDNDYCSELEYCRNIYKGIELNELECLNNGESKEPISGKDGGTTTMGVHGKGNPVVENTGRQSDNVVSVVASSKGNRNNFNLRFIINKMYCIL
ncbi:VIR-like CYIR protein [Plasmodium cynomolgi strain B]|uniref:VIR-like CYIR protein n=1 Tax=Plasmodium cynomolgi (strain B) TaxID=1120755 RepID=K6V9T5_PLACD|nr:VIR-like CYIR protein [Plasmodium cynomolgi strain B]GAB65942.1 VIR-like CYIR protein [Plasmodium cynomolgi strain B]